MRKKLLVILSLFAFVAMAFRLPPPPPDDLNARLKALYIFNFTNMVEWPSDFKKGTFNIAVLGESGNFYTEMSRYNAKTVGSQQIKVTQYTDPNAVPACHILFVAKDESDKTASLVKKFKTKSTMVITEKEGALKDGAIINFIIRNNKQSYELSKTNAAKHKLIVGKQLTELAVKVE